MQEIEDAIRCAAPAVALCWIALRIKFAIALVKWYLLGQGVQGDMEIQYSHQVRRKSRWRGEG